MTAKGGESCLTLIPLLFFTYEYIVVFIIIIVIIGFLVCNLNELHSTHICPFLSNTGQNNSHRLSYLCLVDTFLLLLLRFLFHLQWSWLCVWQRASRWHLANSCWCIRTLSYVCEQRSARNITINDSAHNHVHYDCIYMWIVDELWRKCFFYSSFIHLHCLAEE